MANLSQLTHRSNNNVNPKLKTGSYDENAFPTNGISTISSAIREQKIDPKKDNFGLYALKCDRSNSLANARRGVLLNLPTTMIKTKAEINSFQSMERTHEVFQSCEKILDEGSSGIMYDGATSSASGAENKTKIQPPPRRKKRPTATRNVVPQPAKQLKKPFVSTVKQANQNIVMTESLEKNESGLYRIAGMSSETAKLSIEESKKKEHVVTMVKPKVQKAVAVKTKPVQQQVAKVKSYEWNKHQRKSSVGNVVVKPHFTKRYVASESSGGSFKSQSSVDIFQSNKLKDQRKLFDEFDALFDKSKDYPDLSDVTPEITLSKLNALKFPSSSFSVESGTEDKTNPQGLNTNANISDFSNKNLSNVRHASLSAKKIENFEVSSKPKIVHEQPKVPPGIIKKKILYYDDKHEFQQLIMNQSQSTTIINNHFNATVLPSHSKAIVPITCSPSPHSVDEATGQFDLNGNDASEDYRRTNNNPKASDTNSNSLRIFSNEGIFVFNL